MRRTSVITAFEQRAVPAAGPGGWQQRLLYAWVLALVSLPLLINGVESGVILVPEYLVDVRMHAVIELFCGVTALLIAGLTLALSRHTGVDTLHLFAAGFLIMGLLDVLHAFTSPGSHTALFVSSHTLSILSGGILFCLGTIHHYRTHRRQGLPAWLSRETMLGLAALVVLVLAYHLVIPVKNDYPNNFSAWAYRTHELSGLLYAFAAILAFLYYRATRQRLALVIGAMLMLFAESAYLFRFSQMWDSAWWTWHFVKAGLYTGSLVVIAAALVTSLRAVQQARAVQDSINRELRSAYERLDTINQELQVRNSMVSASIGARSLEQTLEIIENTLTELVGRCRYSLILRVPQDEAKEFQRGLSLQSRRWNIRVTADQAACANQDAADEAPGNVVQECARDGDRSTCLCLSLRTRDQVFGYLRMETDAGIEPASVRYEQLNAIAAEIGPIVHNALLQYRWTRALAFRAALLKITAMLGSSLELPSVLEAVCGESAKMLDSEASGILLAREHDDSMALASCCVLDKDIDVSRVNASAWYDTGQGRALLERLRDTGHPLSLVRSDASGDADVFPLGTAECMWGSLALFPMLDGGRLVAVMLIMRKERIPFSAGMLEQGELLAEQVRVALVNARAYAALRRSNEQLRHSEQERVRSERLAVLGQMAASVAHEVRNPLSAINNCLAVLRSNNCSHSDNVVTAIEIIDDEVHRLDRLTHNFMSFGRAPRPPSVRLRLAELVTSVCERIERHIRHEDLPIRVDREIRGSREITLFDADGFQEVLWNLMLNATQAIAGPGRVRVRLSQGRRHAFLAVIDSGPGVARDRREQIFEPFFSQRSAGAGLGLAIVRQHIESWDGRLRVWGPPGACFALRFPIVEPPPVCVEAHA